MYREFYWGYNTVHAKTHTLVPPEKGSLTDEGIQD